MGVSENSVPLNPMVNDHYSLSLLNILNGYFIGNIPYFQTNPYIDHYNHHICSSHFDVEKLARPLQSKTPSLEKLMMGTALGQAES